MWLKWLSFGWQRMSDLELRGVHQAAILLLSLGQKQATQVLKYMQAEEIQRVAAEMASLKQVPVETVDEVMQQFVMDIENHTPLAVDSGRYVHQMLIDTLGKENAGSIMNRITQQPVSQPIDRLKWMEPELVADLFQVEHPQMLAMLLSLLGTDQASAVLLCLSHGLRADIIKRLATMETASEAALTTLDEVICNRLQDNPHSGACRIGGVDSAAEILMRLNSHVGQEVLGQIHQSDARLGRALEDKMLVFEHILALDGRLIQALLKEIPSEMLLMALQDSSERVQDKFWSNMSKRAVQVLREELSLAVAVPRAEIEEARREIMRIARRLQDAEQDRANDQEVSV